MHTRKLGVGRNILRVFEIALFFAVSALGYGLMIKASSFNSKSKSRELAPQHQRPVETSGDYRESGCIPGTLIVPNQTTLYAGHSSMTHADENFHFLKYSVVPTTNRHQALEYHHASDHIAFPHNLLQLNPVLLI
jgi:hypothetical protein